MRPPIAASEFGIDTRPPVGISCAEVTIMPDVPRKIIPIEFTQLTKQQQCLVRKLTWETLKADAPFVVVIPSIIGGLGALIGIGAGVVLGRQMFFDHSFRCLAVCTVVGTGIGVWIGCTWLKRECQSGFKNIIREHRDEIEGLTASHDDPRP